MTLYFHSAILIVSKGGETMTQGERIKSVRKSLNLTLEKVGDNIGLKKNSLSQIENGRNSLTEANARAICREFNVNEEWLKNGTGEMFDKLSDEEEVAELVSDILEDGTNNPLFDIILDIIRVFNELSPESQKTILDFAKKLGEQLSKKKEG